MTLIFDFDLCVEFLKMYQQMKFLGKGFQKLDHKQDRQTDANRTHYDAAFADGKNIACIHAHLINT